MDYETIIGIDLGTTNSEVAAIRDGRSVVLPDEDGDPILPSVVGLDPQGHLLVGKAAGIDDPDTLVAMGVVVGFVPAAITWAVGLVCGR